jgi:hypothetical protein
MRQENAVADTREDNLAELFGASHRRPEQRDRSERKPDRVDRVVVTYSREQRTCDVFVVGWDMRLARRSVTRQVEGENLAACFLQQVDQTASQPRALERACPTMHEENWWLTRCSHAVQPATVALESLPVAD